MDSNGFWGLSPGGMTDGITQYGAVCATRAYSGDPGNSACTAGWRYVRNAAANQGSTPSYCYAYLPEARTFQLASEACTDIGGDIGGVLDAVQNAKLLKLSQHPLVTQHPSKTWGGVLRAPTSAGAATCRWENGNTGAAATYFN